MRIDRVTLDRYGAFTGLSVALGPGLTVVYGPNEAGKTTLVHAIGDLLWGLAPRQHPYAFEVAPSRLQVTAEVEGPSGPRSLVVTGRGCRDAVGDPVERWWVGGAASTRRAWETGLGIDRDRLRDGGRAVLRDGGDLADLLFRARTGVDLAAVRDRLAADAEAIWRRHRNARTVTLRVARQDADELSERLAEAVHAADAVGALVDELRRAEEDLRAARAASARLALAKEEAQRDARAHGAATALAELRRAIGGVLAVGDVLTVSDLARFDEIAGELAEAERDLRAVDADLAELDAIPLPPPDPDALGVAGMVDELWRGQDAETERRDRIQDLHGQARRLLDELRQVATAVDPALALVDDDHLRAAAPVLVPPADMVDLLDRLADPVVDAQRAVDEAARRVRAAEDELVPTEPAADRAAHGRWEAARQVRDRVWQEVRAPWVAGDLPEQAVRDRLADELDGALAATDVAAGDAAAEAESLVEIQTRAEERRRRLAGAQRELADAADRRAAHLERWCQAVQSCDLPEVLDVPAWRVRCDSTGRLAGLLAALARIEAEAAAMADATGAFHRRVAQATGPLGIDPADPLVALAAAQRRVTDARRVDTAAAERGRRRSTLVARRAKAEAARQRAAEALAGLTARAPDGDVDELVGRSRRLLDLRAQERSVLDRIRAAAPGDDPDSLAARLAELTPEQVEQAAGRAGDEAGDAGAALEQAQERRTRLAGELRDAQQDRDAAALHQQHVDLLDAMAEHARRWARLQLMAGLLDRVVRAESPMADADLLRHAGVLASALTGGRVQGLSEEGTAGEQRALVVRLAGDLDADVGGLSEGTADQVFLALRLAGIRQRQDVARSAGAETLPVVLDDVLMAHDDRRTEAALGVLVDEARDQQVLLLTHHRAVARSAVLAGAAVVDLGSMTAEDRGQAT